MGIIMYVKQGLVWTLKFAWRIFEEVMEMDIKSN
jgi:hypothetical protein